MSFKKIVAFCFFIFPHLCWANLSIEPFIGGGLFFKNSKMYYASGIGGRIGYSKWGLMMGLDLGLTRYSPSSNFESFVTPQADNKRGINQVTSVSILSSDSRDFSFLAFTVGPSVSFGLPLFFDAYASLVYALAQSNQDNGNISLDGLGLKLGVAYLSLPFLSINLELQILNYFQCQIQSTRELCKENSPEDKLRDMTYIWLINLSFPISTGFF